MGDKRRDKKGRILMTGENQDASGCYVYRYTDQMGKRRKVTSWRLTEADVTPPNKNNALPLQ